jgi:AbiV family abortive infection protein
LATAYALEQCGRLLRDANALYRNQSYASTVVLTAFAREELGRWKMLLALRREVVNGKQVTLEDVDKHCGDHVARQKAGMMSVVLRANNDTGLGKLMRAAMTSQPGTPEWDEAEKKIKEIQTQLAKRVPGDRHDQRMTALYVDPLSSTDWNRPKALEGWSDRPKMPPPEWPSLDEVPEPE